MVPVNTLEAIRSSGNPNLYPVSLLARCQTALVLFAAAFLGRQDAVWIEEAGVTAICVDINTERLAAMQLIYPDGWQFVWADAYQFAAEADQKWDLVSVDCPTGQFEKAADALDLWCSIARVAVVLGTAPGEKPAAPDGWMVRRTIRRSTIANWTVLEPA